MFTHVMIGKQRSGAIESFLRRHLRCPWRGPGEIDARGRLVYIHAGSRLMVTTPIDGKPATVANGGTIGLVAPSPAHVKHGTTRDKPRREVDRDTAVRAS